VGVAYLLTRKVRVDLPGELVEEIEKRFKRPAGEVVKSLIVYRTSSSLRDSLTQ